MIMRVRGGKSTDVAYTHQFEGSFNVTTLLAAIDDPRVQRATCPFIKSVVRAVMLADTSEEAQRAMTPERAEMPVLVILTRDGTGIVADGNNRLRWRIAHDLPTFRAYVVPYEMAQEHRLYVEQSHDGITWTEVQNMDMLEAEWGKHHPASRTPA